MKTYSSIFKLLHRLYKDRRKAMSLFSRYCNTFVRDDYELYCVKLQENGTNTDAWYCIDVKEAVECAGEILSSYIRSRLESPSNREAETEDENVLTVVSIYREEFIHSPSGDTPEIFSTCLKEYTPSMEPLIPEISFCGENEIIISHFIWEQNREKESLSKKYVASYCIYSRGKKEFYPVDTGDFLMNLSDRKKVISLLAGYPTVIADSADVLTKAVLLPPHQNNDAVSTGGCYCLALQHISYIDREKEVLLFSTAPANSWLSSLTRYEVFFRKDKSRYTVTLDDGVNPLILSDSGFAALIANNHGVISKVSYCLKYSGQTIHVGIETVEHEEEKLPEGAVSAAEPGENKDEKESPMVTAFETVSNKGKKPVSPDPVLPFV